MFLECGQRVKRGHPRKSPKVPPGVEGCKATSWGREVRKGDAESTKKLALIDLALGKG